MHPFSTPWKHQKTVRFSDVFWGQRKGALGTDELILSVLILSYASKDFQPIIYPP